MGLLDLQPVMKFELKLGPQADSPSPLVPGSEESDKAETKQIVQARLKRSNFCWPGNRAADMFQAWLKSVSWRFSEWEFFPQSGLFPV